jgi:hypothetical protein
MRLSVDEMLSRLNQHTDQEYKEDTIRNVLNGLCGQKQNVPKKYHCENSYLKKLSFHPDNAINYRLTEDGRRLLSQHDTPLNLRVLTGGSNGLEDRDVDFGFDAELSQGEVRPHKCWWREEISEFDANDSRVEWSGRRAVLAEKDIDFEVVEKEVPDKEQSVRGERLWYQGRKIILFRNSVLIKYDLERSRNGIFEVLDEWWTARTEAVEWIESTFGVRLRSTPLDISMPLSCSEWGDVRNSFAEWIRENPVFQDGSANSLFEVMGDDGTRIFHVDTSPTDSQGNSVAEGEFPDSQFGAEHIVNMKQAVKWLATLEVTPADFSAAVWTRNHRDELEKAVEFDQDQLNDLGEQVELNRELIEDTGEQVESNRDGIEGIRDELMRLGGRAEDIDDELSVVEDEVRDNRDRLQDFVERLDGSREEVHEVRSSMDQLRGRVVNVSGVVQANRERGIARGERLRLVEQSQDVVRQELVQTNELLQKIYEEQQKSVWEKMKEAVSNTVDAVTGTIMSML